MHCVYFVLLLFFRTEGRWFWVGLNKRDPEHLGAWEWSDGSPVSTWRGSQSVRRPIWNISKHSVGVTILVLSRVSMQVVTSFIEDKNEEDDRRDCAVYSDLTNALLPQPCDTKHEWICKLSRGNRPHATTLHAHTLLGHTSGTQYLGRLWFLVAGDQLNKPYWYTERTYFHLLLANASFIDIDRRIYTVYTVYNCPPCSPTESEPWVFYHGAEYLLAKQPFDWDAVSLACQMMGAYLLSIHSREELHFVKERLQRVCCCHCSYS